MVIMLQHKKSYIHIKILMVAVIAASLAACSNGTETASSPTDSASSPATSTAPTTPVTSTTPASSPTTPAASTSSSSSQITSSPASVAIPGVNNISEIKFKPPANAPIGFFDGAIDGSSEPKIEVPKGTTFKVSGWAILSTKGGPADMVIITNGNAKSVVAVAPVKLARPDVAKALKNPAYKNSGWSTTVDSSSLSTSPVVLNAWAYNSATKEATKLNNSLQVVVK